VPSRALAGPEAEVELGLAAVGDFDAAAVADCAAAIVRLHGGDPVRTTLGGFLTVRDRGGASEGEVAARDGGPVLLSGGRYLRDMIDAAEGRSPSLRSEARHRALREAVGVDAALVVSWIAPRRGRRSWRPSPTHPWTRSTMSARSQPGFGSCPGSTCACCSGVTPRRPVTTSRAP
jgi:hypothetical protein